MKISSLANAINPQFNCVVSASAGTGKTWLLISRILRLLLDDTPPGNIVAITFTRKAAAEMQARLTDRLREFATCSTQTLDTALQQLEIQPNASRVGKARLLYENLLHNPYSVKTTTYHAFCQELLRRFPLEADIPPGFELREQTRLLQSEAWDELFSESTRERNSPITTALEYLFEYCGSLYNTKSALLDFLEHRLDWWLLCEGQEQPLAYALHNLQQQNKIPVQEWQAVAFFSNAMLQDIRFFQDRLNQHATKTNTRHSQNIDRLITCCQRDEFDAAFAILITVFLKKDGDPYSRKESKTQLGKMGEVGQQQFLDLHHSTSEALLESIEIKKAIINQQANQAWYIAGYRLIEIYQSIKLSGRLLDFNDLEWHSYQLLQHSESAQWVQYKLDSRIDHLLIDEFQDTNPTQWQLVLPLLQEMAASDFERTRSIFLVGDEKQSIYGFRRAEPKLFKIARQWLIKNLASHELEISKSWRSAQVIMDLANIVFSDGALAKHIVSFPSHSTHFNHLYGRIEILPLINADPQEDKETSNDFRNPLEQPRQNEADTRYAREAEHIASTIDRLVKDKTIVGQSDNCHYIDYDDIIILMRSRTHISAYEHALRNYNIPYSGGDKKGLLDCLEIQDMMALLEILVTPHNNLALAHVLRSPLFNASHDDLQHLAKSKESWYEYLVNESRSYTSAALEQAATWLPRWHKHASQYPVHDVLDKIYYQADVLKAYQRVVPEYLRGRVNANLQYLIELALDVDSGRYPSMQRFLWNLQQAKAQYTDAPEQPNTQDKRRYVRLLTIHAAKGLEASVVFLVDAARTPNTVKPYQATVEWPVESPAPQQIFMRTDKKRQDSHMQATLDRLAVDEQQEDTHLLYVALTRAKQYLYISGVRALKGDDLGWLGIIASQCQQHQWADATDTGHILRESGHQDPIIRDVESNNVNASDPGLIKLPETVEVSSITKQSISPSDTITESHQASTKTHSDKSIESMLRGQAIHRAIELLSQGCDPESTRHQMLLESQDDLTNDIDEYINEALRVVQHLDFTFLFNHKNIIAAYNEVPFSFMDKDQQIISGIIDRVVLHQDVIYIVDYKTHRNIDKSQLESLAEKYRSQMYLYEQGIKRIWNTRPIQQIILFTHPVHSVCL